MSKDSPQKSTEEFNFDLVHNHPFGTPATEERNNNKKERTEELRKQRKTMRKMPNKLLLGGPPDNLGGPPPTFDAFLKGLDSDKSKGDTKKPDNKGGKRKRTKKKGRKGKKFPKKYLPKKLTRKDRKKQRAALLKSKKSYKKGKYVTRKKVKSFKSKTSNNILNARKMYKVEKVGATRELSRKTGCSVKGLNKIIKKGQGAYYSSGSRPNQTAHSWGVARLASSITAGKAAAVDFHILEEHCDKKKKAYKMGLKAKRIHGKGTRKVPKTN
jgi:hypothetical protein